MLYINLTFDPTTRALALTGQDRFGGTTVDNTSVSIRVSGVTSDYSSYTKRIDFGVLIEDSSHHMQRPFGTLIYNSTTQTWDYAIPGAILAAAGRTRKLPLQLVMCDTQSSAVVSSRNILTLDVTLAIDAVQGELDDVEHVMVRGDSWAWDPTVIYFNGSTATYGGNIYVSLVNGNVGHTPSDTQYWSLVMNTNISSVNGKTGTVVLDADDLADGTDKVMMTPAERAKVAGIASGAQVNVLEGVKMDGDALPVSGKAVDLVTTDKAGAPLSSDIALRGFVNSSIATNAANYISKNGGPFDETDTLPTEGVTNNDYAFKTGQDVHGNTYFDRYKATVSGQTVTWAKEYRLNNSSFTAVQWEAISSGINATKVAKLDSVESNAEVNIIETVKVDGTALPVNPADRSVNIAGKENAGHLTIGGTSYTIQVVSSAAQARSGYISFVIED